MYKRDDRSMFTSLSFTQVLNTVCSLCIAKLEALLSRSNIFLTFEEIQDPTGGFASRISISRERNLRVDENVGGTRRRQRQQLTCDFCRKAFHHKGDLNKHRRKHTDEQPYTCTKCQQKFSYVSNLIRHQRTRSGIKFFSCQTFARKLSVHLKRCIVKL